MFARPEALPNVLGGDASTALRAPWLVRMIAVREMVLGVTTLTVSQTGEDVRSLLMALSLVDGAKALVLHGPLLAPTDRPASAGHPLVSMPSGRRRLAEVSGALWLRRRATRALRPGPW
jgi:hypothetical protein